MNKFNRHNLVRHDNCLDLCLYVMGVVEATEEYVKLNVLYTDKNKVIVYWPETQEVVIEKSQWNKWSVI